MAVKQLKGGGFDLAGLVDALPESLGPPGSAMSAFQKALDAEVKKMKESIVEDIYTSSPIWTGLVASTSTGSSYILDPGTLNIYPSARPGSFKRKTDGGS